MAREDTPLDQEVFDRVMKEQQDAGTDKRVAEGRARSAAVRAYKAATGAREWVVPVPFPGALGRALRDGTLVASNGALHGTQTYADWLASER